jgi:hypothetical protein
MIGAFYIVWCLNRSQFVVKFRVLTKVKSIHPTCTIAIIYFKDKYDDKSINRLHRVVVTVWRATETGMKFPDHLPVPSPLKTQEHWNTATDASYDPTLSKKHLPQAPLDVAFLLALTPRCSSFICVSSNLE